MQRDIMPMSKDMNIVQEPEIIGKELIKDFITYGDCRLLFDQQDLRHILYNYKQLGFMDINDIHFDQFENSAESFLKNRNESDILALILIKGDKGEIMDSIRKSTLSKRGIQCFFAHSNTLEQYSSLRIYFFDKSSRQNDNTSWRDRLNKAEEEVHSNTKFVSFDL